MNTALVILSLLPNILNSLPVNPGELPVSDNLPFKIDTSSNLQGPDPGISHQTFSTKEKQSGLAAKTSFNSESVPYLSENTVPIVQPNAPQSPNQELSDKNLVGLNEVTAKDQPTLPLETKPPPINNGVFEKDHGSQQNSDSVIKPVISGEVKTNVTKAVIGSLSSTTVKSVVTTTITPKTTVVTTSSTTTTSKSLTADKKVDENKMYEDRDTIDNEDREDGDFIKVPQQNAASEKNSGLNNNNDDLGVVPNKGGAVAGSAPLGGGTGGGAAPSRSGYDFNINVMGGSFAVYPQADEDSHFFAYFTAVLLICAVGYVAFHNKRKIMALIIEGRHSDVSRHRRVHHGATYRRLDTTQAATDA